ncbi:hypothetical protein COO91_05564 [Nostoc flagelliforme CCNUN1]|uniref:Uncharacterized protein n=1 Tax=Nostoc flagelliforme CCNUN1 TaxID=2038116 RepID=A0A2K8SVT3_9NOSO|nr:hypothetical protein COO91_05564 [Nostoc flagelliforme CCNUN1]
MNLLGKQNGEQCPPFLKKCYYLNPFNLYIYYQFYKFNL